jgi:hypothetical protein
MATGIYDLRSFNVKLGRDAGRGTPPEISNARSKKDEGGEHGLFYAYAFVGDCHARFAKHRLQSIEKYRLGDI